jgi:hypothetical protein
VALECSGQVLRWRPRDGAGEPLSSGWPRSRERARSSDARPAVATTGPSISENSAGTHITAVVPQSSLMFYWAYTGSQTWNPEQVAPPGSVT